MNKPLLSSSQPVGVMSAAATVSSDDEGIPEEIIMPSIPKSNQHHLSPSEAEVVPCRQEIFDKIQEKYDSFAKSSPRKTSTLHQDDDKEISQQLSNEVAKMLNEGDPILQNKTDASTNNTHGSQEHINTASLVRLLSYQMEKFDQLLQKNEQSQETILRLQQGSDWLKDTCEAFQRSEAMKLREISLLERKIDDLEKLVVDMKLNQAESRSREDHYKLKIANLERLLEKGVQPRRQRNGGLKHTQSLTLPSASNARSSKEHPETKPRLARSFSSFLRKADNSDRSGGEPPKVLSKVAVSMPSHRTDNSHCSSSDSTKKDVPRNEDDKVDITVPRSMLKTTEDILREPANWYNPKRSINNSPTNDAFHPTTLPSHRETHLSNITDITDEAWDDVLVDEAGRSFGSDSSPCQAELDPPPVFEPAGPQMKLKLSFRGKGTQPKKKAEEDSHDGVVPTSFLSYC